MNILKEIPTFCDLVVDTIRESTPNQKVNLLQSFITWCKFAAWSKKKFVRKVVENKITLSGPLFSMLPDSKIAALFAHAHAINIPIHEAISHCRSDAKASLFTKLLHEEEFVRRSIELAQKYNMRLVNKQEDDELLNKITLFLERLRPLYVNSQSIHNRKALLSYFSQANLPIDTPLARFFDTELVLWNAFAASLHTELCGKSLNFLFEKHLEAQIKEAKNSFAFLNYDYEEKALTNYIQKRISATCNAELDFFLGMPCNKDHEAERFSLWKHALEETPWISIIDIY